MAQQFWKDWKRKTKLEELAIESLKAGRKIILDNIPKNEIIAIYAKGSFIRREMKKGSDVDLSPILRTRKYILKLKALNEKYKNKYSPYVNIGSGYTLWELKTGKKLDIRGINKPNPARIIKHLPYYKLIYGKDVNKMNLFQKDDKSLLINLINTFNSYFLPRYKNKKFWFSEILKQVFWLVEFEQRVKGINPPHSWKALDKSIKDENHIIHDTFKYRQHKPKDRKLRAKYITKLSKYLRDLEKIK